MHNAPPSPFLQSSLHTSLQSGVVVPWPLDRVVLVVVVNAVVVGGFIVDVAGVDASVYGHSTDKNLVHTLIS